MNTATTTEPTFITDEIRKQAQRFVYSERNTRWDDNHELSCKLNSELCQFDRDARHFDAVAWLVAGLEFLSDGGEAADFAFKPHAVPRNRPVSELLAAGEAAFAEEDNGFSAEQIAVTRAWIGQSLYAIWKRAQHFEEYMADVARENALDFLEKGGTDMRKVAEKRFGEIVWAWYEDRAKDSDRLLENKDLR